MTAAYDCQTCGACCYSPRTDDGYVRLYDIDLERLAPFGLPVIMQKQGGGDDAEVIPKLGTKFDGEDRRVCVAFEGSVGSQCACGVYEDRPQACRRFEVGGVLCREARAAKGLDL